MTPETRVKRMICSYLTLKRGFIWVHDSVGIYDPTKKRFRKNHDPYRIKGVSDIIGIWHGKPLAIEVKTPQVKDIFGKVIQAKTYPTVEQVAFIEKFKEHGGIAFVARSIEDVERELGIRPKSEEMQRL